VREAQRYGRAIHSHPRSNTVVTRHRLGRQAFGATYLQRLKAVDDARDSFPGEHWLVLGAGLALWGLTRKSRSPLVRTLGMVGGTTLVGRAASGRDGLRKLLRFLPVGRGIR
jgi:hypothetical protein